MRILLIICFLSFSQLIIAQPIFSEWEDGIFFEFIIFDNGINISDECCQHDSTCIDYFLFDNQVVYDTSCYLSKIPIDTMYFRITYIDYTYKNCWNSDTGCHYVITTPNYVNYGKIYYISKDTIILNIYKSSTNEIMNIHIINTDLLIIKVFHSTVININFQSGNFLFDEKGLRRRDY